MKNVHRPESERVKHEGHEIMDNPGFLLIMLGIGGMISGALLLGLPAFLFLGHQESAPWIWTSMGILIGGIVGVRLAMRADTKNHSL